MIEKGLRERYGIKEGGLVEQIPTEGGILLVPVSVEGLLGELEEVAERVGRVWPKGVSSVEAIREDRGEG